MERLTKDSSDGDDPMMQNLPIVTSCTFYSIGAALGQQNLEVTNTLGDFLAKVVNIIDAIECIFTNSWFS